MTATERLQRDFFLACFAALDPERATDAAGVAEPPPVSAPGGSPTTTLAPGSGAPAGGTSSAEADARVARPNIIAACRGAAEPEVER